MGLGDIFGSAAGLVTTGGPIGAAAGLVKSGFQAAGEALLREGNRARTSNTSGRVEPQRGNPASNITTPVVNAGLATGERYGRNLQNKVDAAIGFGKLGKTLVTNPTEIGRGIGQAQRAVRDNPRIILHTAATIGTEMAIDAAMDPTTYLGGGALLLAAGAERTAARSAGRAAAEVGEGAAERVAARSADDIAGSIARHAVAEAPEGLDEAMRATTATAARRSTATGRAIEAIDTAPANLRETFTGNPVGRIGQRRIDIGERLMPGPQESIGRALVKDTLQGSPTLPTQGAGLGFRQAKWRAGQVGRRAAMPSTARTTERIGLILNDPSRALSDPAVQGWAVQGAQWAVREHPEAVAAVGGIVAANAAVGAYGTYKGLTGGFEGGDEGEAAPAAEEKASPAATPAIPTVQDIGLQQFNVDRGYARRASRRRPNAPAHLGTVTNDTMPRNVGPKNWYGPSGGYDSGRGFRQRTPGVLPPLEQPNRDRDVLGV